MVMYRVVSTIDTIIDSMADLLNKCLVEKVAAMMVASTAAVMAVTSAAMMVGL